MGVTVPLPVWVRCLRVRVRVDKKTPGGHPCHTLEMLAIMRSLEEWRHFLKGVKHKVEIWMDHKNLEYFMTAKKLNHRQAQWSLYLLRFDFVMHHHPGKSMGKCDALSQRADHDDGTNNNCDSMLL